MIREIDLDHIFGSDTNMARVSLMMTKTICTDVGRPVQIHLTRLFMADLPITKLLVMKQGHFPQRHFWPFGWRNSLSSHWQFGDHLKFRSLRSWFVKCTSDIYLITWIGKYFNGFFLQLLVIIPWQISCQFVKWDSNRDDIFNTTIGSTHASLIWDLQIPLFSYRYTAYANIPNILSLIIQISARLQLTKILPL